MREIKFRGKRIDNSLRRGRKTKVMTIEELKQASDDMLLIMDVIPDFILGRSKRLSDEETEKRARSVLNTVNAMLDVEIARQSVGDGEIQRAISLMEWCKVDVWKNHPIASEEEIADAVSRYDLAIDALRVYRKSEIERRNTPNKGRVRAYNDGFMHWINCWECGGILEVYKPGDMPGEVGNYCRFCGVKFEVEDHA